MGDQFAAAVEAEGEPLARAPVAQPQAVVVPAWRFAEAQPVDEQCPVGGLRPLVRAWRDIDHAQKRMFEIGIGVRVIEPRR